MPDEKKISEPNFEGETMKMPENTDIQSSSEGARSSVINGPLLLILTILLVLILGGMYYWFTTLTPAPQPTPEVLRPTAEENNEPESTTAEAQADMMQVTSPSDEISAIEADLGSTDLESLDAELNAIDAEIDAALQ